MRARRVLFSCLVVLLFLGSLGPSSLLAEAVPKAGIMAAAKPLPVNKASAPRLSEPAKPVTKSVYTVTESVYLLAVDKTELVIYPGDSVAFTNDTAKLLSITTDAKSTNDIRFDYVSYNADGKVTSDDLAHTGSASVYSKGGTTIITVDYDFPLTVSFSSELSYTYTSIPALLKKTLRRGESYLISNQSLGPRSIMSDATSANGKRYDYAVYKADDSLETSSFDAYTKPSFSVSDTIILTGASNEPVTVGVPYEGFFAYETDEPAYDSVILNPGESYTFTNVGTRSDSIEHAGTTKDKFDYVIYNDEGTETSRGTSKNTFPSFAVGKYIVVTLVTANPVRVGAPYRTFMGGDRENEAITRVTLSPGTSYKFTNNGTLTNPVNNNARKVDGLYDYTVYKADGSYSSQGFDAISTPRLPAGGFAIITVQGTADVTFDYTDDFSAEVSHEPSHFRITLSQGESYEFTNITSSSRYLRSDATSGNRFDWVEYYPDGTEQSRKENTYTDPMVSGGNSMVVTAVSAPVTFGAHYRLFSWEDKPGEAISKQVVHLGESYKFTNNGTLRNPLYNNAREVNGLFDYTVYEADGSYSSQGFDTSDTPYLPPGGFAIVTVHGTSDIIFDYTDDFSAEPSDEPSHFRVTLSQGESYEFTNITSSSKYLRSNATSDNRFDWVEYYPDGTEQSKKENTYTDPMVSGGNSIVVTAVSAPVTFGASYRLFTWRDKPGEAIPKQVVRLGESYTFSNAGSKLITITSDAREAGGKYDVVVYNEEGRVHSVSFEETGNVMILARGYAVITGQSASPVTFSYSDTITVASSAHPALLRATVAPGSSYTYKNISDETEFLYSNVTGTNEFAYIVRRPDGTVYSEAPSRYTSVQVPAGYSATVTPLTDSITFGAVYTSFTGTPGENPVIRQVTLSKNESYLFTNLESSLQTLTSDAKAAGPAMYDYAIYRADGLPEESKFDQDGNLSVSAGSQAVVTVTTDLPVTFTYGQAFQASPSAEPALLKRVLEPEQLVGFKNIGSFEAKLVTNASSSANRYFDYTILDAGGSIVRQGEHATVSYNVPAGGTIRLKTTSANPVLFTAPYRNFEWVDVKEYAFEDLLHRQVLYAYKEAGQDGYYRFTAPEAGRYRFAAKEMQNFAIQPIMTLYDQPDLLTPLASSEESKQEFGADYTVLEFDLEGGKTYYLKISERNALPLELQLMASIMAVAPAAKFDYEPDGRLNEIVFPTGDKLIYEYDNNGNLKRRIKQVFPFQ